MGTAAGCDLEPIEPTPFEDGARTLTEEGAFHVELWSVEGAPRVGPNTFEVIIAMPDPTDPRALGRGIPNARVQVDAFMPNAGRALEHAPRATYMGEGHYLVSGMDFDHSGVWTVEVDIRVGATIDDHASFTFEL